MKMNDLDICLEYGRLKISHQFLFHQTDLAVLFVEEQFTATNSHF